MDDIERNKLLIEQLKAENAMLKKTTIQVKVAEESGKISAYHGGRFPITVSAEVWERLFEAREVIEGLYATSKASVKAKRELKAAKTA